MHSETEHMWSSWTSNVGSTYPSQEMAGHGLSGSEAAFILRGWTIRGKTVN